MVDKADIINRVISEIGAKSYLEIGVAKGANFSLIKCDRKKGVDPATEIEGVDKTTSDRFFSLNTERWDVIFIDGLHHADQVERDIVNSWDVCDGVIFLHDVNPPTERHQQVPRNMVEWTGDVWKAFIGFREAYPEIESGCYDIPYGLGWIKKNSQKIGAGFSIKKGWEYFNTKKIGL